MYDAPNIEKKWQKRWMDSGLYTTSLDGDHDDDQRNDRRKNQPNDQRKNAERKKFYGLVMFPYPSGDKLHVGHWYNFAPVDSYARYMRMKGYRVFEPIGFDSFGLPAENYAIKTGVHPMDSIAQNCETMRQQLRVMGTMYDWSKEVVTSSPEYYQWTQWVFLQLYKKGLAYRKKAPVNWCPGCQTVLANEQVVDGQCERCKSEVTKKNLVQWFFAIREYVEQLLNYEGLEWPEKTMLMQKEWIGKSVGCDVSWKISDQDKILDTFTTTVDTIYGVTFVVISPEHPLVEKLLTDEFRKDARHYMESAKKMTDIERVAENREKTGVFSGTFLIHPFTGEKIPLWIADYALMTYGTGVVMGVPAHDQRDMEFAKKYKLPVIQTAQLENGESFFYDDIDKYIVKGKIISEEFSGVSILEGRKQILSKLEKMKMGKSKIQYKLRDWLISRQRYWGAPIPIIYCEMCGDVPVPEQDLPVLLPREVDFIPRGKSPLAYVPSFLNISCPKCGGPGVRESDTMDTFVDSSWYFLRYPCANLRDRAFDPSVVNNWMPVDLYVGGPEHACMHLLYARFIHKVLHDLGYVSAKEPFQRLVHQGLITKNSAKMSKSKGNVVSPDEFVNKYGSDVFRLYLMFMGPFEAGGDWNDTGIVGIVRFVERFWNVMSGDGDGRDAAKNPAAEIETAANGVKDFDGMQRLVHKTIARVTRDVEIFHFNTAISALMEFLNGVRETGLDLESRKIMTRLIAPIAPHLAEETWERLGGKESVFDMPFPIHDESFLVEDSFELVVQVNGKVRAKVQAARDISEADALAMARELEHVKKYLTEGVIKKELYVPGRLVNFVVG